MDVWPDNVLAVSVFESMFTQWRRAGMNGIRVGLDYTALSPVLSIRGIPKKQWPELFEDLRVMEDAALEHLSKQK